MDSAQKLTDLLRALLEQLPSLLVMLACMIYAIVRWRRHPRVSALVLLSLGWLIACAFISAVVYNWIPDWFLRSADPSNTESVAQNIYLVLGLVSNVSISAGLIALLAAIFTQRGLVRKDV
jgi:hypothetical protein